MYKLNNKIEAMFASKKGSEAYERIIKTVEREKMLPLIDEGVLLGFSGGADSVFLLCFLVEYRKRNNSVFSILATHVNHCIRDKEAESDEYFAKDFCYNLNINFESIRVNVPELRSQLGIGMEEAARIARYEVFDGIISGRNDISSIAVAHNATDNVETVLMNIFRGSGLSGVCGIKPVRKNIIRPLISISKAEILSLLDGFDIPYVTDSTNLSSDYTRNYVRNEILPLISRLSDDPESAIARLTTGLRADLDYINVQAEFFINNECSDKINTSKLRDLHPSIRSRVLSILIQRYTDRIPEEKHISALHELIMRDNFIYSLPGDMNFIAQRGICVFSPKKNENNLKEQIFSLIKGENKISGTNLTVYIGEFDKSSLNVYNFSIQAYVSSAIIDDGLTLRFRREGDSYKYSGITHKLKKVFNDRNIPPRERDLIPIICDKQGITVIPGMSGRDGSKSEILTNNVPITFAYSQPADGETELFTALLRR